MYFFLINRFSKKKKITQGISELNFPKCFQVPFISLQKLSVKYEN